MKQTTYPPNLVDRVAALETIEELEAARDTLLALWEKGELSRRTARRLEQVANERYRVIKARRVQVPRGGVMVPRHLAEGKVILGPDGKPAGG